MKSAFYDDGEVLLLAAGLARSFRAIMPVQALFTEKEASTVRGFLTALGGVKTRPLWFRGQNNEKWRLRASLVRPPGNRLARESILITRFRQNAFSLVPFGNRSEWDWLFLMQHWGVQTRLLDWTENPLAALFFATTSMRGRNTGRTDGSVWCLDPIALNRVAIPRETEDLPFLETELLSEYLPTKVAIAANQRPPAAVLVERQFPRMVAQAAVFTVFHKDDRPIDRIPDAPIVGRILIPREAKTAIRAELERIGVTRLMLFPELDSVADVVREYLVG